MSTSKRTCVHATPRIAIAWDAHILQPSRRDGNLTFCNSVHQRFIIKKINKIRKTIPRRECICLSLVERHGAEMGRSETRGNLRLRNRLGNRRPGFEYRHVIRLLGKNNNAFVVCFRFHTYALFMCFNNMYIYVILATNIGTL
jgi:hypothetical protein